MTSRQRLLTALEKGLPDRLPVTTHHLMYHFLDTYMGGISDQEFFDVFDMDAIFWTLPLKPDPDLGQYWSPPIHNHRESLIETDEWNIRWEEIPGKEYPTFRYRFITPGGELSLVYQEQQHTGWLLEPILKTKKDIDILGKYMPPLFGDEDAVNQQALEFGERGIIRGHFPFFEIFGQPGCWQDASCLFGIQDLIMETFEDPVWVHELLKILLERKKAFINSIPNAKYDLLELGGGDASTTVISPKIFREFVAPYDSVLIDLAHQNGQRVTYHTCGGMMPILEDIAEMNPDAMETFTPVDMGGDVRLAEAKERIGDRVCMIGSFDQFHFFTGSTPEETRAEVRRCFEAAGSNGGFILSPSDHFFDADIELIRAFADEAKKCVYD
jgi:hypothetical protein